MNRLTSSSSCRLCRRWLEGDWSRAVSDEQRVSIQRQMDNGMCDGCQARRQAAAHRFIAVADHVRLINQLALAAGITHDALPEAYSRAARDARNACEALRMWPGGRLDHRRPERFRGDGDDRV